MIEIVADSAPEAYVEAFWCMKVNGATEESRNGPVLSIPSPVCLTLRYPLRRVLFDHVRNANPFFHVMETIWMLAGSNRVGWPAKFNRNYVNYAETDGYVHGAYGQRWRWQFNFDQIPEVIRELKRDHTTRQAVLEMWDPAADLGQPQWRDRPCNTHVYFRPFGDRLDMTVCNRSNDLLWGMLGANVVHFTYLHELIATGAGMEMGTYRVISNNLHVYTERPDVVDFMKGPIKDDRYQKGEADYVQLLDEGETVEEFLKDCERFLIDEEVGEYDTAWINYVAVPMIVAWKARIQGKLIESFNAISHITAPDWRIACREWTERKTKQAQ